jgi:hypothetical protein
LHVPDLQAVPKWFTAGRLPDLGEDTAAEAAEESTSSDDEPTPEVHPQPGFDITEGETLQIQVSLCRLLMFHVSLY